jgi:hypothetical protein
VKLGNLEARVEGDQIVVTLPGTSYRALFYPSKTEARLLQAEQVAVNKKAPMYHEEFEGMAWEAANTKARELGWIPPDSPASEFLGTADLNWSLDLTRGNSRAGREGPG